MGTSIEELKNNAMESRLSKLTVWPCLWISLIKWGRGVLISVDAVQRCTIGYTVQPKEVNKEQPSYRNLSATATRVL